MIFASVAVWQLIALCLLSQDVNAQRGWRQLVFGPKSIPTQGQQQTKSSNAQNHIPSYQPVRKVAIIGAGAGGSSAAYFLSKAQSKLENLGLGGQGIEMTIFERDERIGGRTTIVHPYNDEGLPAVELGASIFASVNKNMIRASQQFNLTTGAKIGESSPVSVWDGQQFLVEGLTDSWWNSAKMFWRYGYSPVTTQKLVQSLVDKFLRLYDPTYMHKNSKDQGDATDSGFPWASIEELARAMELDGLAAQTAEDYFYGSGVSKLFVEEMIEAFTLVNYGQDTTEIHGVGGSVSLAASGATGVVGGNYQIFESMIARCESLRLRFGIHGEVTGLARFKTVQEAIEAGKLDIRAATEQRLLQREASEIEANQTTTKWWLGTKSGFGDLYDAIFIATPWHSADITLLNTHAVIPTPAYVHLHVTIVVTKAEQPNPLYFGRGEKDVISKSILTSRTTERKLEAERRKQEKKKDKGKKAIGQAGSKGWWPGSGNKEKRDPHLEFNSLTYLMPISARDGSDREDHVVKIFSSQRLEDSKLEELFGNGNILWTYRKEWDAYPYLLPRRTFPALEVDDNLYFLNAMETLVSTMETATVSARNAVARYLKKLYGSDFVHGGKDCPWQPKDSDQDQPADDWAAWGCRSA